MDNFKTSDFKLTTRTMTFRPYEAQDRLVDAAMWLGVGVYELIEDAIRDRLCEIEDAMRKEKTDES